MHKSFPLLVLFSLLASLVSGSPIESRCESSSSPSQPPYLVPNPLFVYLTQTPQIFKLPQIIDHPGVLMEGDSPTALQAVSTSIDPLSQVEAWDSPM